MDIIQQIINILKKMGIPLIIVIIVFAAIMLYRNYLEIRLLNLNIKQAERDLEKNNSA